MKKWLAIGLSIAIIFGAVGLVTLQDTDAAAWTYEDADYRGVFADGGDDQVNVQFTLEDNIITDISYRHLYYGGTDYEELEEGDSLYGVTEQYEQVLDYLEGKDVRNSLEELYDPGNVIDDVDGFSGATLRANKVISAVRDALNRGAYRY
ncbi:FMN-binding protein [Fuchsiella alkaliacetigena]|uniref:FMN-binding protein n=1 Tax=Fuchsiella alkaliacetigena TaxID=957042 RepID=UPI00200A952F|nr:FMN-binding protein [Fuchsiella alkaliacetigena]MCK8825624.1 FMN-binding protein [Fuchsiella alkaliacetigena]